MSKFLMKASVVAMAAAFSGYVNAATLAATATAQATESFQATTVYTLPAAVYTLGVSVNQDWYITYTLNNGGLFTATPTATVSSGPGSTATLVAGGAGSGSVTFRINGSTVVNAALDTVTLAANSTATVAAAATTSLTAANGLLFISGAVASPLESVTYADAPATSEAVVTFAENWAIIMGADTDYIDVLPVPASNSRKVFGNLDAGESAYAAIRVATITNAGLAAPDRLNDFATGAGAASLDTMTITLTGDLTTASAVCVDGNADGLCGNVADLAFTINGGTATRTLTGATLTAAAKSIVLEKATTSTFTPVTLTLTHALTVAADATRAGVTAHDYTYSAPLNNTWPFEYVNGTVLRSGYTRTGNRVRIANASAADVPVISATQYPDTGASAVVAGFPATIEARRGILHEMTGVGRGHLEVVVGGASADVEGSIIMFNGTTGVTTEMTMQKY